MSILVSITWSRLNHSTHRVKNSRFGLRVDQRQEWPRNTRTSDSREKERRSEGTQDAAPGVKQAHVVYIHTPPDMLQGVSGTLTQRRGHCRSCRGAAENGTIGVVGWGVPPLLVWRRTNEACGRITAPIGLRIGSVSSSGWRREPPQTITDVRNGRL